MLSQGSVGVNILLIEDDERIIEFVARGLRAEGHTVEVARTGPHGLELGRMPHFDIIILDLMLPGMHGHDVCQQIRAARVATPIIMLTAMDRLDDKIEGLRLGADDYLTKPFAFGELLARIEALMRRRDRFESPSSTLQIADLTFDRETLEVRRGERTIELTAKELALLELMMSSPGRVLSRTRILETIWGYSSDPLTNVVDVYIRRLRLKVDQGHDTPLIKTVRGIGYKLEAIEPPSDANDDG